jgi:hypothetical protein
MHVAMHVAKRNSMRAMDVAVVASIVLVVILTVKHDARQWFPNIDSAFGVPVPCGAHI